MVAITRTGLISAIGNNTSENLDSLLKCKSGIQNVAQFKQLNKAYFLGKVRLSDSELKKEFGYKNEDKIPRTCLLSMKAISEALHQFPKTDLKMGLISGTSVGGMDMLEDFYFEYKLQDDLKNIDVLSTHDNGAITEILAKHFGIKQDIFTLSTACSSSANAIMLGAQMIQAGLLDQVIVGGGDALTKFTLQGFESLMIYDNEICKPFDENRAGLNLGEGAAYLILESEKSLKETQNEVLAHIAGWANTNDAHHQTASSPEGKGATLAINQALQKAEFLPADVDYICAHGTATPNNDLSESNAMINVFGDKLPPFSSLKGYTGHTLAAAGAIEAVYSVLAIGQNKLFANINYQEAISETKLQPILQNKEVEINTVVSNSFGFGGNCTSLVFSS